MLKIRITGKFDKSLEDLLNNSEPELENTIKQRIKLFRTDPQDTRLENHPLTGRLKDNSTFSITEDIRIVYEWLGKTTVRFLAIGSHIKVYQKPPRKSLSDKSMKGEMIAYGRKASERKGQQAYIKE